MSYEGKQLNVVRNGNTEKELIKRELKTKGIVRTEEGNEYPIDEIFKRGRGIFIEVKGKGGARAKTKPAPKQTPAVREVTVADVEGKKIDGREVVKVQRSTKKVKLEDGTQVDLADVRRVGRGFTADLPATGEDKPKAKTGGARAKPKAEVSEEIPPLAKLKGQTVLNDGEEEVIERVFKSGKIITDAGTEFQYDELEINDGVLSIAEDELELDELDEELELDEDVSVPELVAMKGETIQIDGEEFKVVAVAQKSGRLKLDNGEVVDYSDVQAETDGSLFIETDRPSIIPKRTVASVAPGRMPVDVFDAETGADIADVVETAARDAINQLYKTDLITSIAVVDNQYLCVGLYFAADGVSAKEIAAKIAEIRKSHSVAPTTVVTNEELDEEPELEEELDEEELDEEPELEEEIEDEDQDEYGLDFEEDSELEEEIEESESDMDFEFDDTPEDDEPDYEALVENSVDALKTMFNVNAEAFVVRWFESEEVEQSIGFDILPGITTLEQGNKEYVLMGLDDKGNIVVVETQKSSAGKLVRLNGVTMATLSRMEIVE